MSNGLTPLAVQILLFTLVIRHCWCSSDATLADLCITSHYTDRSRILVEATELRCFCFVNRYAR